MEFDREYPTIMDISWEGNNLNLRLDVSDWYEIESYKGAVINVKLTGFTGAEGLVEKLKSYVGELIYTYEFLISEKKISIWLENGDVLELECESINEERGDLTIDELFTKFQWLSKVYQREAETGNRGWRKYRSLKTLLTTEVGQALENLEKKKKYYEHNDPLKTDRVEIAANMCKRVLNYIGQVEAGDR